MLLAQAVFLPTPGRTVWGPRLHSDVVGLFWKAVSQRLRREHGDIIGEDEPNLIFLL